MRRVLGIDLGTTNTVVAVSDQLGGVRALATESGSRLIPSIVSFHPNGTVLVGEAARDRRVIDPANTVYSVKRLLGLQWGSEEAQRACSRFPFKTVGTASGAIAVEVRAGTFELAEISAFVLREAKRVAERATGEVFDRAVITVPANFNDLQRTATRMAARIAGLGVVRILNEPTAAALAYGLASGERERVVIFDFGGGTFDVTVLELAGSVFEVVATAGDMFLGGDDVDSMLADLFADQFLAEHRIDARVDPSSRARLREAAAWAKHELSVMQIVDVSLPELAYGPGGKPIHLFCRMNQPVFEQRIRPIVDRTLQVTERALAQAGLAPSQVDNVVLVGGSTRMPLVRRMVQQLFGREPLATMDPDMVVALGAAVQAHALQDEVAPELESLPVPDVPTLDLETAAPGARRAPPPPPPRAPGRAHAPPVAAPTSGWRPSSVPSPVFPVSVPPPDLAAPVAAAPPPLLLDVTPFSLNAETVGGFCEPIIPRNAPIPCEQSRVFGTAHDGQTRVVLRVCQGESRRFAENQPLGELELDGIEPKARGAVQLKVSFSVDADGTLGVEAEDAVSGRRTSTKLHRLGAIDEGRVEELRKRHDAMSQERS